MKCKECGERSEELVKGYCPVCLQHIIQQHAQENLNEIIEWHEEQQEAKIDLTAQVMADPQYSKRVE